VRLVVAQREDLLVLWGWMLMRVPSQVSAEKQMNVVAVVAAGLDAASEAETAAEVEPEMEMAVEVAAGRGAGFEVAAVLVVVAAVTGCEAAPDSEELGSAH
jgi:hypothetical protein